MSEENYGKESGYNEASFQMQRIDRSRQIISELMVNLTYYNSIGRKHNYEMVITELLNLSQEIKGKLSDTEKKTTNSYRDLLINLLELHPPHQVIILTSIGGNKNQKFLNRDNWNTIRTLIFSFYDFIVEMLEKHEFSAPNKDEGELWD
jgi:hypothetical protein